MPAGRSEVHRGPNGSPRIAAVSRRVVSLGALVLISMPAIAQSIFTIAGGGTDDGRPATLAAIDSPYDLALDTAGNVVIAVTAHFRVRRVDRGIGTISLVAGVGLEGFEGDGGPATKAKLSFPWSVGAGPDGSIYIADGKNYRIRRVDPAGVITTFAGTGQSGFGGDGGPATQARIGFPEGFAFDANGNLYFADGSNLRVRRIDAVTGIITTVAGGGSAPPDGVPATQAADIFPEDVAIDRFGNLFITTTNSVAYRVDAATTVITKLAGTEYGFSGDGGPATAARLANPQGIATDPAGNIYIADTKNHRVRRIDGVTGVMTTVAGSGPTGAGADGSFSGDGGPATAARLDGPYGVKAGASGDLYIADTGNQRIRRVDLTTGIISTLAGNGNSTFLGDHGPATAALIDIESPLGYTGGTAVDAAGNLYIADSGNQRVRRVDAQTKAITTVAGNGELGTGGEGVVATNTPLRNPGNLAVDRAGSRLYLEEFSRIRFVDLPSGIITTYAGSTAEGFSGDGGPSTLAKLQYVNGMALDSQGNLYLADTSNFRIRRIDRATGIIDSVTMGGYRNNFGWSRPTDVALDEGRGVLYILQDQLPESGASYSTLIRYDMATKERSTLVERLPGFINALDIGPDGDLYFSDGSENRILHRDLDSGAVSIVAGDGTRGFTGDGGPATMASIYASQVTVDSEGGVYFANETANRIRYVPPCIPLTAPMLSSPADGSSGVSTAPRLQWQRVPGAQRYELRLDTVNPPVQVPGSGIESTSFSPANLEPLTTYYWQVVSQGDAFCSPQSSSSSEVRSFTTASGCRGPAGFEGEAP